MAGLLTVTVTAGGRDPVTVTAYTRHQVQWERYARARKIPAAPGAGFGATEYASFLAWSALRETNPDTTPDAFDLFVDQLDDVAADEPEPVDPTRPAAG